MKRFLSPSFILSLPATGFVYPELFQTANDNPRRRKAVLKETNYLLTDLVDYIKIDEQNSYSIHYKNGAFFSCPAQIGIDGNTCYVLEAFLASGITIVVERALEGSTYLNDLDDYQVVTEEPVETEELIEA